MFLVYYNDKDGNEGWIQAQKEESIKRFIEENEIEDYGITVNENEYYKMINRIIYLEKRIDTIKTAIEKIIK